MEYFEDDNQTESSRKSTDLSEVSKIVVAAQDSRSAVQLPRFIQHNTKLKSKRPFTFYVYFESRVYMLAAPDSGAFTEWLGFLASCVYGGIVKQGWLRKMGHVRKKLKKRFFVLNRFQQIKYFADERRSAFLGLIACRNILTATYQDKESEHAVGEFALVTESRRWVLVADDNQSRVKSRDHEILKWTSCERVFENI